ncbi:glycopeptide antibiotics resistance protein [Salibacterium salarium]|uniref:VanZ family protein n=1 Tax=Salibacterium salarium TaxID=284579 RepID=UPI0027895DBC|nr:VanZ family protein [Salibacterium salarium]MDQ0299245.1 glycopeptide antibiotics resistance protein [Salibacterium salarium]
MKNSDVHINEKNEEPNTVAWRRILLLLLFLYLAILFYVTLFAWNHGSSYGPLGPGGRNYNVVPFRSIYRIANYSPNLADPILILGGNVIMFFPFGAIIAFLVKKKRKALWLIPSVATLLSIFIEMNQYIFTHRVANVDDVLLNSLGGFLGAWFILIFRWGFLKFKEKDKRKTD